jgi:hypothetical protein
VRATLDAALAAGGTTPEEALALFDALAAVPVEAMRGTWKGAELPTGHPLTGLLAAAGWYGKRFDDAETVHPLLFHTADRRGVFAVDPGKVPVDLDHPRAFGLLPRRGLHALVLAARPIVGTRAPAARLRMVESRGVATATMIYDAKPILDAFRRVDDDTVLGAMDLRGDARPFFFVLRRDPAPPPLL